jgi:hypothetical protein
VIFVKAKLSLGSLSRGLGLAKMLKHAQVMGFVVYLDFSPPLPALAAPKHPNHSGLIVLWPFCILLIDELWRDPQISDPVVPWVAIDVVDVIGRPLTVVEQPSDTMRLHFFAQKCTDPIPAAIRREGGLIAVARIPVLGAVGSAPAVFVSIKEPRRTRHPDKFAGFWVVLNQAAHNSI